MYKTAVCIPAFNEETTIRHTLESMVRQSFSKTSDFKIWVCANGCTDNTAYEVLEAARQYPNISLISRPEKGKAKAWNCLHDVARQHSDFIVFSDADIIAEQDSISALHSRLYGDNLTLVGAVGVPVPDNSNSNWLYKFLNSAIANRPSAQTFLMGGLYAMQNCLIEKSFSRFNFTRMPDNLIADDYWLSLVAGNNWTIDHQARFLYRHHSILEEPSISSRWKISREQIQKEFPELLGGDLPRNFTDKVLLKIRKLQRIPGLSNKLAVLRKYLIRKAISKIAKDPMKTDEKVSNAYVYWPRSSYSKQPIILHSHI